MSEGSGERASEGAVARSVTRPSGAGHSTAPVSPTRSRAALIGSIVAAVVSVLAFATLHEVSEGARAMHASDVALAAKNPELALAEAHEAATHVAPFSPWSDRGYARLEALAEDAEARGDDDLATSAWQAIRAAETATRGPLTSDSARRKRAEAAIGRIDARRMLVLSTRTPGMVRFDENELARRHGRDVTPSNGTFALFATGAVLTAVAAAMLLRAGFAFRGPRSFAAIAAVALGASAVALALGR